MKHKGIRIGYSREWDHVLRYPGPGHLITVAPTRTGKGRDILIPALLDWPHSCIVIDPKGELAAVTSARRRRFGDVVYLDPYRLLSKLMKGAKPSRYNPMARLQAGSLELSAQTEKISDGLIWDEGENNRFFTGGARGACSLVQMGLVAHGEPDERNLVAMRSVITGEFQGGVDLYGFAQSILDHSGDTALRQKAARFCVPKARDVRSLADVIQTADEETRFLSDAALAESLSGSDFSFADLKQRVITVYVVLPMDFLDVCGKYFRVVVASSLSELLAGRAGVPVLMLMDEFFQVGTLKAIQNAMGMAAGYGVQLWPVLQDLNQLVELYPRTWETFLSNAAVRMFFGSRDEKTSHYASGQSGQAERRVVGKSISHQNDAEQQEIWEQQQQRNAGGNQQRMNTPRATGINVSFGSQSRALLLPHECRDLNGDEMLLWVENVKGVIRGRRRAYWDEPEFRGQYAENPYFAK